MTSFRRNPAADVRLPMANGLPFRMGEALWVLVGIGVGDVFCDVEFADVEL
jgi:hypothetical protein